MSAKREIHCSALPRMVSCPASLDLPEDAIEIDETGEDAILGTAAHDMLAGLVMNEPRALDVVALKHGVDPDALGPLYHMGRQLWENYAPGVTVIGAELTSRITHLLPDGTPVEIVGRCDVLAEAVETGERVVFDWKSGVMRRNYREQTIGYCWQHGATKAVTVWLRDRVVDVEDVTLEDIEKLKKRIDEAYQSPEKYSPSDTSCDYCPRRFEPCPALISMQKATLAIFSEERALTREQAVALYPRVQLLEKAIERYRRHIRELLDTSDAPILTGDGRELCLGERVCSTLDPIKTMRLWESDALPLTAIAPALRVSKSMISRILSADAPRGRKGKAIEAFLSRLREAGGIQTRAEKFIQVRKSLAKLEGQDDGRE